MANLKPSEEAADLVDATPAALAAAKAAGVDLTTIVGTGTDGRITKGDVELAVAELSATPAALASAKAAGVDLTTIVGTGTDGRITKGDVDAAIAEAPVKSAKPYWYCMEENHPGAPNFQSEPLSLVRIFQSDKDVPECPACGRQVSAVPCDGPDIPPESILELQSRFGR